MTDNTILIFRELSIDKLIIGLDLFKILLNFLKELFNRSLIHTGKGLILPHIAWEDDNFDVKTGYHVDMSDYYG